jgi:hypothetical protein
MIRNVDIVTVQNSSRGFKVYQRFTCNEIIHFVSGGLLTNIPVALLKTVNSWYIYSFPKAATFFLSFFGGP